MRATTTKNIPNHNARQKFTARAVLTTFRVNGKPLELARRMHDIECFVLRLRRVQHLIKHNKYIIIWVRATLMCVCVY